MSLNCLKEDCFNINKKKCDGECRRIILRKLTEMKDVNDLDGIGCPFSDKETKFDRISKLKVEEEMEMRKYLSKLSIYLYNDYEFFSKFIIKQNFFDNEVFKSEMEKLGYIRTANAWFQKQEPEEEVIISNIFNYYFTRFISNSNKTILIEEKSCIYCDGEIVGGKCTICGDHLFQTCKIETEEKFEKDKPADTTERRIDEGRRKCLDQQNANRTKESLKIHHTNIKEKTEQIKDSIEIKNFMDRNSKENLFPSHIKEGDKSYPSLEEDCRPRDEYNQKNLNNHINTNYSDKKEFLNSKLSNNTKSEDQENNLEEINIEEEASLRHELMSSGTIFRNNENISFELSEQSFFWIRDNCTFKNTNLDSLNCGICETNRNLNNKISNSEYSKKDKISNNIKIRELEKGKNNNKEEQSIPDTLRGDESRDKSKDVSCDWECDKCSHVNKDLNGTKCFVCGESRILINKIVTEENKILRKEGSSDDSWICEGCTFVNCISNKICEVCTLNCDYLCEGKDLEERTKTSICKQRKENNSFDGYKCRSFKESADFSNKWVCERCRFFNDKRANKCEVCGNENPNIVKCSQCKEKLVYKNEKCMECLIQSKGTRIPPVEYQEEEDNLEIKRSELWKDQKKINESKSENSCSIYLTMDRRCPNFLSCKGKVTNYDSKCCKKCEDIRWFCPNEDCRTINFLNKYCKKCKVQKDSDVSNGKNFTAFKDNKEAQMWMCGLCKKYTATSFYKCTNCKNMRGE